MPISQMAPNPYLEELTQFMKTCQGLEQKIDGLRRFKDLHFKDLEKTIQPPALELTSLSQELSDLADAILLEVFQMAREEVRKTYGLPTIKDNDGNFLPGAFSIIGMGKLGGRELHFHSDLDIIFLFNRNGETQGGKKVTNQEFYSKLAQRIISYLTLYTHFGYAYKVDTELRPSGNAGALVTPLDPWVTYYHENAGTWEKQALLKARLIFTSGPFDMDIPALLQRLIFISPFTGKLGEEIYHMRMRIENELAKESEIRWHFKKGLGGIVDIEFIVQYLQLKFGKIFEDILNPNTLKALALLQGKDIIPQPELATLKEAYIFYRKIEIFMGLHLQLKEGHINPQHENTNIIAEIMGYSNLKEFLNIFDNYRKNVRAIFIKTLKYKDA